MKYIKYALIAMLALVVCEMFYSALTSDVPADLTISAAVTAIINILPTFAVAAILYIISKKLKEPRFICGLLRAGGLFLGYTWLVAFAFFMGRLIAVIVQ